MSAFPGSPRTLKGAIASIDPLIPLPKVIVFQYNPETMTRSLTSRIASNEPHESTKVSLPPEETISLKIELDATDQLEKGDGTAVNLGIHPQLAALETLIYPMSVEVIAKEALLLAGTIELLPKSPPLTVFIWGVKRILPVQIKSMSINELAYDVNLNPIRSEVSLEMQVLSYSDLKLSSMGGTMFMGHQIAKELMAAVNMVNSISGLG
ncbi:hypothetical protein BJP36_16885 [Moorena producens JHB]|uniref:Uncharacterized protein n=1 Tax=Moorena producens (strain JHB) TaxID=1454205 RepID=A0A1D9G1M9_MOOP1|nr:hypothetical protein [Moorena producens]AOY81330.1 hypothetical protein BJP36_16885 [Moorena producens JHB]